MVVLPEYGQELSLRPYLDVMAPLQRHASGTGTIRLDSGEEFAAAGRACLGLQERSPPTISTLLAAYPTEPGLAA
jgi:hypothetical protein